MLQRALTVSGGGGGGSIIANMSDELGSITSDSGTYTTTKDCILIGSTIGNGSQTPVIYIDGTSSILMTCDSSTFRRYIGNTSMGIGMAIPKGHTISVRSGGFTYDLHFYGLA